MFFWATYEKPKREMMYANARPTNPCDTITRQGTNSSHINDNRQSIIPIVVQTAPARTRSHFSETAGFSLVNNKVQPPTILLKSLINPLCLLLSKIQARKSSKMSPTVIFVLNTNVHCFSMDTYTQMYLLITVKFHFGLLP